MLPIPFCPECCVRFTSAAFGCIYFNTLQTTFDHGNKQSADQTAPWVHIVCNIGYEWPENDTFIQTVP